MAQSSKCPTATGSKATQITALRILMESALLRRYSIGLATSEETVMVLQERALQDHNKLLLLPRSVTVRTMLDIKGQAPAATHRLNRNTRKHHDPLLSSREINTLKHHDRPVVKQHSKAIQDWALKPHRHLPYRRPEVRQTKLKRARIAAVCVGKNRQECALHSLTSDHHLLSYLRDQHKSHKLLRTRHMELPPREYWGRMQQSRKQWQSEPGRSTIPQP